MRPRLLLDIDDVCADLLSKLCAVYNEEHGDDATPARFVEWDMTKYVKCGAGIYSYFDRPGFFDDLALIEGAADAVAELVEYVDVVAVTNTPAAQMAGRVRWIEANLPMIGKRNLVMTSRKELVEGDFIVDDAPHNLGGRRLARFLVNRPHNASYDGPCFRVATVAEVIPIVKKLVGGYLA